MVIKNAIDMYSTHKEGKSVVIQRFIIIRALKKKNYKYMTLISNNVRIDKLDDMVNKCNNSYHRSIERKPLDVKPSIYIDFNRENNEEDPKFKVGNHVRISKYKNILQKVIKKV